MPIRKQKRPCSSTKPCISRRLRWSGIKGQYDACSQDDLGENRFVLRRCDSAVFFACFRIHSAANQHADPDVGPEFQRLGRARGGVYGGTGYADTTSHGGVMRTGVFYRSIALSNLSNADWTTLSSLHISLDIDLRTPAEINTTTALPERTRPCAARSRLG